MNAKPRGSLRPNQDAAKLLRLMPFKVRKLLLVASLYDAYLLEEDGRLTDLLMQAYRLRDLGYYPMVSRATDAEEALEMLAAEPFDLVVAMMRLGDIDPFTFGRRAKSLCPGTPAVLLAYDTPELERLIALQDRQAIDRICLWRGDGKILVGIIQLMEDERNAAADTELLGVPNLLIVEDDLRFTSAYLPAVFEVLWDQTNRLLTDEVSLAQRALRQRGRPRVHLAGTYEEGLAIYRRFAGNLLGVISDIHYPRGGKTDPRA
ncbi:MAG: phosphoenolpyruvate synthase, partial [Coprothermobacterota bacterium]|nr:phosphoenolpyruvate synthase [Coprothermobacterota bacterium]